MIVKSVMVVVPNLKKHVRPVKVLKPIVQSHLVAMAPIAAVLRLFRAVVVTTMGVSMVVLAVTAIGGVLRSTVYLMLGIGLWTRTLSLFTTIPSARLTVFLFAVLGIKCWWSPLIVSLGSARPTVKLIERSRVERIERHYALRSSRLRSIIC